MPDTLSIPGGSYPPLIGEGEGRSYTKHTSYGCGFLSLYGEGQLTYQEKYRGYGCGVLPLSFRAEASSMMIPQYKGTMMGAFCPLFIGGGEGSSPPIKIKGRANTVCTIPFGEGEGFIYNPREGSCDLLPILPYISNFLPELEGAAPSPLPPQDKVTLHVLHSRKWTGERINDLDNWYLLGMMYEGKPAALFRRAPASNFPMRVITDKTNYLRAIAYLGRLWEVLLVPPRNLDHRLTENDLRETRGYYLWG